MEYYQITQIKPDIYRITSPEFVFMELLVGTDRALLIDTGYGFGDLRSTVKSITDKPLYIVNTHGHVDHTCGNFRFDEDIYISDTDSDLMKRHNARSFREKSAQLALHTRDWATGREINGLPEDFDLENYIAGGTGNTKPLGEGMVFDLGGKTVRTIATPGHTKGSMSFYFEEEGWLYVGDAANTFLWLFDNDAADKATYIKTLDKISDLAPNRIYGGHGPQAFTPDDVKMFRRTAVEADYEHGIPFSTPIMPECHDIRVCILGDKTMDDIGQPGFYAILLDSSRK